MVSFDVVSVVEAINLILSCIFADIYDIAISSKLDIFLITHFFINLKAGGVGAYVSRKLNFKILDNLSINVHGCEDLRFNVDFLGYNRNYMFAVIYRCPWNNHSKFFEALGKNMHKLNCDRNNTLIFLDMNINLYSDKNLTTSIYFRAMLSFS